MKILHLISFSVIAIVFVGIFAHISDVQAIDTDNVYGYAWSSNIGWISMNNCIDPDNSSTCVGYDYGVTYNTAGDLSGYAWSSNVGWLKFGDPGLSGGSPAHVDLVTGAVTGWARFCGGKQASTSYWAPNQNCSGPDRTDGWDGWLSLSGTNPIYGVSFDTSGDGSGYAWGSDVVGWVDFSNVKIRRPAVLTLLANGSAGSITVAPNTPISLSSVGANIVPPSGVASSDWNGARNCPVSLSSPASYSPGDDYNAIVTKTFILTCTKLSGGTIFSKVIVNIAATPTCPDPNNPACNPPPPRPGYIEN